MSDAQAQDAQPEVVPTDASPQPVDAAAPAAAAPAVADQPAAQASPEVLVDEVGEPATVSAVAVSTNGETTTVTADQVAEKQDPEEIVPYVPVPNAEQTFPVSGPKTSGTPDTISLPAGTSEQIQANLAKLPNVDMLGTERQRMWGETVKQSIFMMPITDIFSERMKRDGADFKQVIKHNNIEMRARMPSWTAKPGVNEMDGEQAVLRLTTHLGIGGPARIPLWASGFWVTFKPASDMELLELNRIIASDTIEAGRWSYGLALSNTVVYTLGRIFEFALDHVYNTSVSSAEMPIQDIAKYLAPQDMMSFIWGYLCANYPSGFHYQTGCINDPTKCTHVVEANLNVSKLQYTDDGALNEWQRAHMASMNANSMTLENVKRYQSEMLDRKPVRKIIAKGTPNEIGITLKTPTIQEYTQQGHFWIGGLVEAVNTALGMDASDDARNKEVNKRVKATALNQYIHWIESLEFGQLEPLPNSTEEPSITRIVNRDTIAKSLDRLSSTDSIREEIIQEVQNYIGNTTMSIIGVPAYDCPVCGKPQDDTSGNYPRHVSVIPLDVIQVFFALLERRIRRIGSRSEN